ncbi:MAG: hypothetical protein ABIG64_07530 [Candidatus Omnitrophota bacterium]
MKKLGKTFVSIVIIQTLLICYMFSGDLSTCLAAQETTTLVFSAVKLQIYTAVLFSSTLAPQVVLTQKDIRNGFLENISKSKEIMLQQINSELTKIALERGTKTSSSMLRNRIPLKLIGSQETQRYLNKGYTRDEKEQVQHY